MGRALKKVLIENPLKLDIGTSLVGSEATLGVSDDVMLHGMFPIGLAQGEVLVSVVKPVVIQMVNSFGRQQQAPDSSLDDKAVLQHVPKLYGSRVLGLINIAIAATYQRAATPVRVAIPAFSCVVATGVTKPQTLRGECGV